MASKDDICRKIESVLPEAGRCGIDYSVEYDEQNRAWAVDLRKGEQHLTTYIEDAEATSCLENDKCIPLGLQIGQLKRNIDLLQKS